MKARIIVPVLLALAAAAAVFWLRPRPAVVSVPAPAPAPAVTADPVPPTAQAPSEAAPPPSPTDEPTVPAARQAAAPARPATRMPPLRPDQAQRGAPPGDPSAVTRALKEYTPEELSLTADLGRAEIDPPPEVRTLLKRRREGATPDQLKQLVRSTFPRNMKLRLITLRWIDDTDPTRKPAELPPPPDKPVLPLGKIESRPPRSQ